MQDIVVVVDTQADFMHADGALPVPGAESLVPAMQHFLAGLRPATTAAVLFTFDTHFADTYPASPEAAEFPLHCVHGTPGWANVLDAGAVDPAIPVFRLEKGVFAMWAEPGLAVTPFGHPAPATDRDAFFAQLKADGVTGATVLGVAADYCVRWAIDGLVARGFGVTVPAALTAGIAMPIHQVVATAFAGAAVRVA